MNKPVKHSETQLGGYDWCASFSLPRLLRDLAGRREGEVARIPANDLNCVFYLYPSAEAARAGRKLGGSGFWVAFESTRVPNYMRLFAVSNRHVVHRQAATVLRANARYHTGFEIFETEPTDWIEHPAGHDVAVALMPYSTVYPIVDLVSVPLAMFARVENITDETVGIGDDVCMIGRFINHEGTPRNTPSVRFGNISMLPFEPIYFDAQTKPQLSFAIELRSMCGYSGSPVFVEVGGVQRRPEGTRMGASRQLLLGVHWGHIIEPWTVKKVILASEQSGLRPGEREQEQVSANTGMNGVVPAWCLREMFDLPVIKDLLYRDEEAELERRKKQEPGAEFDGAVQTKAAPPSNDENPNSREDFTRLLGAAARKPPQGD